jgi:two-component system CheB/CheR fusion protein
LTGQQHMHVDKIAKVLSIVAERRGIDFRDYRAETLSRGLVNRMNALRITDVDAYVERIDADASEMGELLRAVLIPVTEFFRDEAVFQSLASHVLPSFAWLRSPKHVLRVWSIGTATGEEAWSMAMLLEQGRSIYGYSDFEVVATDLDVTSLEQAKRGVYAWGTTASVPEPLRSRFFIRHKDTATIHPGLRSRVHFVQHDVVGRTIAPPQAVIASFDVILMRNVLIYFDRRLQAKALERIASVVEPEGALVLGLVETLPAGVEELFEVFPTGDATERIFRKRPRK